MKVYTHKGFTLTQSHDEEPDNSKIFHFLKFPEGYEISLQWSPHEEIPEKTFIKIIDKNLINLVSARRKFPGDITVNWHSAALEVYMELGLA